MRTKLVDLTLHLHHETHSALLVSDDGDRDQAVWLPKSQVEVNETRGAIIEITCPEWLATKEGLV